MLHRIKQILVCTCHLVHGNLPYGDSVFERLSLPAPEGTPAARTRQATQLQVAHPMPIQQTPLYVSGVLIPSSARSQGFIAAKLWNNLNLSSESYTNIGLFRHALEVYDWRQSDLCSMFFTLSEFFKNPEIREPARR